MKNFIETGWKVRVGHNAQVAVISARDKADAQATYRRHESRGLPVSVYKDGELQWETTREGK